MAVLVDAVVVVQQRLLAVRAHQERIAHA
jgi:hypothetical protein